MAVGILRSVLTITRNTLTPGRPIDFKAFCELHDHVPSSSEMLPPDTARLMFWFYKSSENKAYMFKKLPSNEDYTGFYEHITLQKIPEEKIEEEYETFSKENEQKPEEERRRFEIISGVDDVNAVQLLLINTEQPDMYCYHAQYVLEVNNKPTEVFMLVLRSLHKKEPISKMFRVIRKNPADRQSKILQVKELEQGFLITVPAVKLPPLDYYHDRT
jgi:hypothetical protein